MREETGQGILVKAGFLYPQRALELLSEPILERIDGEYLVKQLSLCADPDQGLLEYIRLAEAARSAGEKVEKTLQEVVLDPQAAGRLFAILGFSSALSSHLVAKPAEVDIFLQEKRGDDSLATTEEIEKRHAVRTISQFLQVEVPDIAKASAALRSHYWRRIMQIAAFDLTQEDAVANMPAVGKAISALVAGALEAALEIAKYVVPGSEKVGLAIIAMGKLGGKELNYISDVDLIYLVRSHGENSVSEISETKMLAIAADLVKVVTKILCAPGIEQPLWKIDTNLRPEGKEGSLVRTLESSLRYYREWAESWEFQAHIKARPIAGDIELGERYVDSLSDLVWHAAERSSFVADTQAMRRRVESLVPAKDAPRQLKLGPGGLRDVEFTVQLLQLVHGRADATLRSANTLEAIAALSAGGYMSRAAAQRLHDDYIFLRTLEHRMQLQRFRRIQVLPQDATELRRIARAISGSGFYSGKDLLAYWEKIKQEVRALHLEIYYRPLLPEVAKLSVDDVSLQPAAAHARLAAIGYRDPAVALQHIAALTAGISRTAAIQKQLLPVMIGWFAKGPAPDQGLQAFRIVSEELGSTSWYMRTLRDSGVAAERLARVLSSANYIARELPALAEAISWLDDDRQLLPRSAEELSRELNSMRSRYSEPEDLVRIGRYLRRRELLRTALAQVLGLINSESVQAAISTAGDIALEAALGAAELKTKRELAIAESPADLAIIAMGRFGGKELSYASDADLIFVHRAIDVDSAAGAELAEKELEVDNFAITWAKNIIALLSKPDSEPVFKVDADLRPEGKSGPLSRSLESCRHYYRHWIEAWEKQALLRARFCCGNKELGAEFLELVDKVRYPETGLTDMEIREIRRIKARVEEERMPCGVDPLRHVKLGRGGLADIEWSIQLLQLEYAAKYPLLRTPHTLQALAAAQESGLLESADAEQLQESWIFASRIRDLNTLGTGRMQSSKVDVLSVNSDQIAILGSLFGYSPGNRHSIEEDYLRTARRARAVVERIFYGDSE